MNSFIVPCEKCGQRLKAPESAIGKRVKCKSCGERFVVEAPNQVVQPLKQSRTEKPSKVEDRIKAPVAERIDSHPLAEDLSQEDRLSLEPIYAASGMLPGLFGAVLTLLIYWAVVLSIVGITVWHAIANLKMVTHGDSESIMMIPLYVAGIVFGLFFLAVALKPVLSGRSKNTRRLIKPANEPELMTSIKAVCQKVGAPVPQLIDADYELGLKIEPDGWSLDRSRIRLIIGAPIMTVFSVQQFAIMLAAQIAPYSEVLFSKTWLFIYKVYHWVDDVSWRPDRFDARIATTASGGRYGPLFNPFAQFWNLFVFLTNRLPFKILSLITNLACRPALQLQQLNADRFAYNLVGTENFTSFLHEAQYQIFAHESSTNDFIEALQTQYSVNNKFEGMIVKRKYMTEFQQVDIQELMAEGKTFSFDSMNTDLKRIEHAEKYSSESETGEKFDDDRQLREIIKTYYQLATICTKDLRNQLSNLVVVNKSVTKSSRMKRAQAINRYIKSAVRDGIRPQN